MAEEVTPTTLTEVLMEGLPSPRTMDVMALLDDDKTALAPVHFTVIDAREYVANVPLEALRKLDNPRETP
jgi:hypothetical protein